MTTMYKTPEEQAKMLVSKAKMENCWIYFMPGKKWYTPEEFEMLAKAMIITSGNNPHLFVHYHLSDPKEGIRRRLAFLNTAAVELQDFSERVMMYYNFVRKGGK